MAFTLFQAGYGTPSGLGADEGEDLARVLASSSLVSGITDVLRQRRSLGGRSGLGGEKCLRSASLILTGESAPGRSGKRGVLRRATNSFRRPDIVGGRLG